MEDGGDPAGGLQAEPLVFVWAGRGRRGQRSAKGSTLIPPEQEDVPHRRTRRLKTDGAAGVGTAMLTLGFRALRS